MNIIYIVKGFPPEDNAGVPQHVYRLANHLPDHVRPFVLCGNLSSKPSYTFEVRNMKWQIPHSMHTLIPTFHRKLELTLFFRHCQTQIKQLKRKSMPFIIHGHTWHFGGKQAISIAEKESLPVVITLHGMELDPFSFSNPPSWISHLFKTDIIIVQKRNARDKLQAWGIPENKVHILIGPVNTKYYKPSDMKNLYPPTIAIVGRLDDVKRPTLLFRFLPELVKKLPNVQVLIAGDGPLAMMMRKCSRETDLDKHIKFMGWISETLKVYQKSHVYLALSRKHNSSDLSLLEAMSCGLVPIATRSPGIDEIISDGISGIIASSDGKDLAEKIAWIFHHPETHKEIGQNARKAIIQRASLHHVIEAHISIYSKIKAVMKRESEL